MDEPITKWAVFWKKKDDEPVPGGLSNMVMVHPGPYSWVLHSIVGSADEAENMGHLELAKYAVAISPFTVPRPQEFFPSQENP